MPRRTKKEIEEEREQQRKEEEQKKNNEATFKKILMIMGGIAVVFLLIVLIVHSINNFQYKGVKFQRIKDGNMILYQTKIPVVYQDKSADYNFYLRNDPRKLAKEVPLNSTIWLRKNAIFDTTTSNLFCDGDWTIALANLRNLYQILGINISIMDNNTIYEPAQDYMYLTINEGNSTEITSVDGYHYKIDIANCEVLPALERVMLDAFVRFHEAENQKGINLQNQSSLMGVQGNGS